jgi:hypothetical protein
MELYADGQLIAQTASWPDTQTAVLTRRPKVLAMKCIDYGGSAGLILSTSNGLTTDNTWRCSSTEDANWNQVWNHLGSYKQLEILSWKKKSLISSV